jgi:hypothetical protein
VSTKVARQIRKLTRRPVGGGVAGTGGGGGGGGTSLELDGGDVNGSTGSIIIDGGGA